MGEYHYMGFRVTIGGSDSLWAFKCIKCGHKKYSMFKQLQNPEHICSPKQGDVDESSIRTQGGILGTETDSDAEGDF